jgi:hypothetical protein
MDNWFSLSLFRLFKHGVEFWSVQNVAYVDKIFCYLQELVLSSLHTRAMGIFHRWMIGGGMMGGGATGDAGVQ